MECQRCALNSFILDSSVFRLKRISTFTFGLSTCDIWLNNPELISLSLGGGTGRKESWIPMCVLGDIWRLKSIHWFMRSIFHKNFWAEKRLSNPLCYEERAFSCMLLSCNLRMTSAKSRSVSLKLKVISLNSFWVKAQPFPKENFMNIS